MAAGGRHFKPKDSAQAPQGGRPAVSPGRDARLEPTAGGRAPGTRFTPASSARAPRTAGASVQPPRPAPRGAQAPLPVASATGSRRVSGPGDGSRVGVTRFSSGGSSAGASPYGGGPSAHRAAGNPPSHGGDKPRRTAGDIFSYILIGVGVVLLLVSAGLFVKAQMGYKASAEYNSKLEQAALKDTEGKGIPKVDFAALKEVNDDVVGWIYIPDTKVNYVVAQGKTNDTYLRHLLNGEWNAGGTVFMDMDGTAPGAVDQQTTIYGHHMNDGSMFKFIDETTDQATFNSVKEAYYITDGTTYVLKPLYTMVVQDDYVDARKPNFDTPEAFHEYLKAGLKDAKARAVDADERIEKTDRVVTLVTCAGEVIPRTTRAGMVCEVVDSFEN